MRRAARWAFHGTAVASLVLLVGTVGLWGRSYTVLDQVGRPGGRYVLGVTSHRGMLWVRYRLDGPAGSPVEWRSWDAFAPADVARLAADTDDVDGDGIADSVFVLTPVESLTPDPASPLGFGMYNADPSKSGVRYLTSGGWIPSPEAWRVITLTHWCPTFLTAVLPALWLTRWRRSRACRGVAGFPVAVGRGRG